MENRRTVNENFEFRYVYKSIINETNRLGIIRPGDDYNLLNELRAVKRNHSDFSSKDLIESYIVKYAKNSFENDEAWKSKLSQTKYYGDISQILSKEELGNEDNRKAYGLLLITQRIIHSKPKTERPKKNYPTAYDKVTMGAVNLGLDTLQNEYKKSATYFAHRGVQTRSVNYGGSRSHIYFEMLRKANNLKELQEMSNDFKGRHKDPKSAHDEYGGILRILGRRLAWIPFLGNYLEKKVKEDDNAMKDAKFEYPDDVKRVLTKDDGTV